LRYSVTIHKDNTIEVFDNSNPLPNNAPFLRQPFHPDARPWESKAEAEAWAENYLTSLNNALIEEEISQGE